MAYVKLDTGILNSTLWFERECREVFITALLMAMPREFTDEQRQIEVRSLEFTGFVVPPGWYGFVEAAGVGIVRRASVDTEVGLNALGRLGGEDPESRSEEFGGRRMIRVNGGYLVLNFIKYRDKDHTAAERSRRYRDRKASANATSHRDIITSHRNVTQADAESESEAIEGADAPRARAPGVSDYGRICGIIRAAGIQDAAPGHMKFRTLVDAGASAEEFLAHIPRCIAEGKRFAYLLGMVGGERKRAAEQGAKLHTGQMPSAGLTVPAAPAAGRVADELRAQADAFRNRSPEQVAAAKAAKDAALGAMKVVR